MISLSSCSLITKPLLMFQQPTLTDLFSFSFPWLAFLFGFMFFGAVNTGFGFVSTVAGLPIGSGSGSGFLAGVPQGSLEAVSVGPVGRLVVGNAFVGTPLLRVFALWLGGFGQVGFCPPGFRIPFSF